MAENYSTLNQDLLKNLSTDFESSKIDDNRRITLWTGLRGAYELKAATRNLTQLTKCCNKQVEIVKMKSNYQYRCCKCKKFIK